MAEMARKAASKRASKRDVSPNITNFITINGTNYSLGDLRKADFSALQDPKASVLSIKNWAVQLNNILRGFAIEETP